MNRSFRSNTG